jgi:hypothetical protein
VRLKKYQVKDPNLMSRQITGQGNDRQVGKTGDKIDKLSGIRHGQEQDSHSTLLFFKDSLGFLNVTEKTSIPSLPWPQGLDAKEGSFFMPRREKIIGPTTSWAAPPSDPVCL